MAIVFPRIRLQSKCPLSTSHMGVSGYIRNTLSSSRYLVLFLNNQSRTTIWLASQIASNSEIAVSRPEFRLWNSYLTDKGKRFDIKCQIRTRLIENPVVHIASCSDFLQQFFFSFGIVVVVNITWKVVHGLCKNMPLPPLSRNRWNRE